MSSDPLSCGNKNKREKKKGKKRVEEISKDEREKDKETVEQDKKAYASRRQLKMTHY